MNDLELVRRIVALEAEIERLKTHDVPGGVDPGGHDHSKLVASDGSPDPALSADATGQVGFPAGVAINEFSSDGTLAGNSDLAVPTEKAVKTYIDAVGIWQDWTPTVDQGGAVAVTATIARYTIIGDTVHLLVQLDVTGSGSAGNAVTISNLPANSIAGVANVPVGVGRISTGGGSNYIGNVEHASTTTLYFRDSVTAAQMGINPSFALASGHKIWFSVMCERA
jgi:hypothetical protein